jgi:hypothetical protein
MKYEQMTDGQRSLLRTVFGDVELDSTAKAGFLHPHWPGWKEEEDSYTWTVKDGAVRPITWREWFDELGPPDFVLLRRCADGWRPPAWEDEGEIIPSAPARP